MITRTPAINIPQHFDAQSDKQAKPLVESELSRFHERCGELSFALFELNPQGKELLTLWEHHYFYSPVAVPGMTEHMPYFIDGQNNFIRQIRKWCKSQTKDPESKPAQIIREVNHGQGQR